MKKIISAKDVETLLRQGKSVDSITADAILTPSAKDMLRSAQPGYTVTTKPAT